MLIDPQQEFERQIQNLLNNDYPTLLDISPVTFRKELEKLKAALPNDTQVDIEAGKIPFVIVVKSPENVSEKLMDLVEKDGKNGFSKMYPHESKEFHPIASVTLPEGFAYLLVSIDRGKETLNVPPNEALLTITAQHRSPLTIDEGIALITHFPDALIKNNCFSLLASRCEGNKRVPAIWINANKQPNMGWCWDGNPHTWLGSASCLLRVGAHDL
jgi:hypothetical protein